MTVMTGLSRGQLTELSARVAAVISDVVRPGGRGVAAQILGGGTALVDDTIAPTWDWAAIPDLFSGKAGYPGMNLQIAATLGGPVAAIGPG